MLSQDEKLPRPIDHGRSRYYEGSTTPHTETSSSSQMATSAEQSEA